MSSCSVYGASDDLLTEDSPTQPLSLYAQSKLRAEKILAGHSATILRLGTLYGIADAHARIRLDLVVNALTARAFYLNEIKVFGGKQYRPLLHVKDVAAAIRRTIGSPHTGIFNLHHENLQIIKVAEAIRQAFPDVKVVTTEMEFEDQRNYRVVSDKAREMLGFSPVRSVSDGIRELHAVLKDGRIKNINNPRYSNANFIRTLTSTTRTPLGVEIGKRL